MKHVTFEHVMDGGLENRVQPNTALVCLVFHKLEVFEAVRVPLVVTMVQTLLVHRASLPK